MAAIISLLTVAMKTYRPLLRDWAPGLRSRIRFLRYRDAMPLGRPWFGPCIFTDLERLSPRRRRIAATIARRLDQRGCAPILNQPGRHLGRVELANRLHDCGINAFNVFRLDDARARPGAVRYPVFLRGEHDHSGPRSPPVHSPEDLPAAVESVLAAHPRLRREDLIVVEFLDCRSPDGLVRKYGCYRIGDRLIPRHLYFGEPWAVKGRDNTVNEANVEEEQAYRDAPPVDHMAVVQHAFDLAGIEYGRIDYSLFDGRPQVWEINTNPFVVRPRETVDPRRMVMERRFVDAFVDAMDSLVNGASSQPRRATAPTTAEASLSRAATRRGSSLPS